MTHRPLGLNPQLRRELGISHFCVVCYNLLDIGKEIMESKLDQYFWARIIHPSWRSLAAIFIRLSVGLSFFLQSLLKCMVPNMGVNRFLKIGFAHAYFTTHFVGAFEDPGEVEATLK